MRLPKFDFFLLKNEFRKCAICRDGTQIFTVSRLFQTKIFIAFLTIQSVAPLSFVPGLDSTGLDRIHDLWS